jgi:N-acetylneuraminic acid mutarotase
LALKREFGFYCIELDADPQEVAFVIGGTTVGDTRLASVERYDVSSGTWRGAAPMATARSLFGLCELSDGNLHATGGANADAETLASVECYDPGLDTWSAAPSLPRPRYDHCVCAVGDAMYVVGGLEQFEEAGDDYTVSSVLKFDCRMQTWREMAPMPEERDCAGACVLGSDIYIFGGKNDNVPPTSTTYRLNTETNEWATLSPMPEAKSDHSVCVLNGLIYLMGGDGDDDDAVRSVHRFDPVANLWSTVAPMSVARTTLRSFVLGGSIYAVGGYGGGNRLSSMERYSVASDSWSEVLGGELSRTREAFGALVVRSEMNLFDSLIIKAKSEGQ